MSNLPPPPPAPPTPPTPPTPPPGGPSGPPPGFPSSGGSSDAAGGYPATFTFDAPYEVARWRPFVHWLLVIPQEIVAYVLQIIANVITFIAFFTILFTKKYPDSLFNIVAMTRRYQYRVLTYALFMRESYPPFTFETVSSDPGGDPSHLSVQYPGELNRWAPLYKWFIAIPHYFVLFFLEIAAFFVLIVAFFAVIFTGE
ncbi:MAG TPA: DUF4389 domain-containing protein, partial [Acidimicrobiales bacterium]|nr:DUF4389 domain-containing protein [Acidimicrobiales bacterium]